MSGWALVGVPHSSMARDGGIATAIAVLREVGLAERLADAGVEDAGDLVLPPPSGGRGPSRILNEAGLARLVEATRDAVLGTLGRARRPVLVGGDCPVVLGPLAAIAERGERPGLLMLDGHEDAWPPERSATGEASDSEVAIAIGRVAGALPTLERRLPLVDPWDVALLGPRDADELDAAGVPSLRGEVGCFLDDGAVREVGARAAIATALAALEGSGFWLHVDLDVLETGSFGAVDYPQPGGLSWAELDAVVAAAARHAGCRGMSVAIYNPDLDPDRRWARAVVGFVARTIAGNRPR